MEEAISHYQDLEDEYQRGNFNAGPSSYEEEEDDDFEDPKTTKIIAEEIIESQDDYTMKLLTNFTVQEFNDLYDIVGHVISRGLHKDSYVTSRSRFLITLCFCKYNEKWKKLGFYFGINFSYAQRIVIQIIAKTQQLLSSRFIKWIGVMSRITDFNIYNQDWPTLLGSLDATVQMIKRPSDADVQKTFYSGKHKFCCMKTQAFVSPTGLLIHCSKPVEGSIHDFKLFCMSNLDELIFKENEQCQLILSKDCITLADAGYQGLAKKIPGAVTPFKKTRTTGLSEEMIEHNQKVSKSRIIVENWFGRNKSLWAIMGSKFRLNLTCYENFWMFCASLTNYHIMKHPMRNIERGEASKEINSSFTEDDSSSITETESS